MVCGVDLHDVYIYDPFCGILHSAYADIPNPCGLAACHLRSVVRRQYSSANYLLYAVQAIFLVDFHRPDPLS